jgi:hypothetical protein
MDNRSHAGGHATVKKTDIHDAFEPLVKRGSFCQFHVSPEEMLEGTLLDNKDGLSIADQQWAIKIALSSTKQKLREFADVYQSEKETHAQYQDGAYLHDLFERIRFLGGIYAFQYFTLYSSFIENLLGHVYYKTLGRKYNIKQNKERTSKLLFILNELSSNGVKINKTDIDFFVRFYSIRNTFIHNHVEIPIREVNLLLQNHPRIYWDVYNRDGRPFFLTISDALEVDFERSKSRLLKCLGQYFLSKGQPKT